LRQGKLHIAPIDTLTLLRTDLLSLPDKLDLMRVFALAPGLKPYELRGISVQDWIEHTTHRLRVRQLLAANARTFVYSSALDLVSADVFVKKLQISLKNPVLYIDGGWQVLVDGLHVAAEQAGARIVSGARIEFMILLDTSTVNIALLAIQAGLHFSEADLGWVQNIYLLFFGGFLLFGGRAADLFGRHTTAKHVPARCASCKPDRRSWASGGHCGEQHCGSHAHDGSHVSEKKERLLRLSSGKDCSHLIEALVQAQFGHLHHLAHRPAIFCHGHFRLSVPHVLEGDRMTLILRKIRWHTYLDWINPLAIFVGKVMDVFDSLHRNDFLVPPDAVKVSVFWRTHADKRCCALPEINLGKRRRKAFWPPPLHHILGIGPGFPNKRKRCVEETGNNEIAFFDRRCRISHNVLLFFVSTMLLADCK